MYARVQTLRLSRPSGTVGISCSRQPSNKSLGYCQMSLRDNGPADLVEAVIAGLPERNG